MCQNYPYRDNCPDHCTHRQSGIGIKFRHYFDVESYEECSLVSATLAVVAELAQVLHTSLPLVEVISVPLVF